MTLFKQIALLLSLFLMTILAAVMLLNFKNANESVQSRLYEDAKNTASSLSLSLGTAGGDISVMSTMINANFDSGNYSYISLVDTEGNLLFERKSKGDLKEVPMWFINLIKIEAPQAAANVSAGWSIVGTLNVQSDGSYAYLQLYKSLKELLISFGIITIIGLVVLNLLLAAILKPLSRVRLQAEALMRNEFIIQEKIPFTKELRDTVLGMNAMVAKVKAMFDKGNEELKRQKEREYTDSLTKLKNRKYFIDKLPEFLKIDAANKGGVNILMGLGGVIEANEKIGHKEVDALFVRMAQILQAYGSNFEGSIVARLNGTEFTLFIPDCDISHATEAAKELQRSVQEAIMEAGLACDETYPALGVYEYHHKESVAEFLAHCDNALTQAKFDDNHFHADRADTALDIMGKDAWRESILGALESNGFSFVSWKAVDTKAKKVAHNVLSITMKTKEGTTYSYGQFMASANQVGLSAKIYHHVLEMLYRAPDMRLLNQTCSLRLSYEYLNSTNTFHELSTLFKSHAKKLHFKLIIELPDKLLRKHSELMLEYKELFEKNGIEVGIFEFIGESSDYGYLSDLRPVYIKAEASYFLNQSSESLGALKLITQSAGISLIAASVMDMATLQELQRRDIHTIQGKAADMVSLG
ncbi:MAG: diguanylate cyclase [Epsilonproteobacteria bacterium]|nr:diguanylate cyclase [Campylobacterota bacterium]